MAFTQDHLACRIDTPLGQDVLLLQSFEGREGVSELFNFRLRLASENESIDFGSIVGRPATVTVLLQDGTPRYIHGVISRFSQAGAGMRLVYYEAELVPWLWLLTRKQDCRIFQDKTAKDIITQVFDGGDFSDYKVNLTRSQPKREYCVQYRETDYDFVCRLMEDEGISYYFTHDKDHHVLVLTDHNEGFRESPHRDKIDYDLSSSGSLDSLRSWEKHQAMNAGKYTHTDYNFEMPTTDLLSSVNSLFTGFNNSALEIYDYPGDYKVGSDGADRARLRMEEQEVHAILVQGSSSYRELCAGDTFELADHYREDFNKAYLLTSVQHEYTQNLHVEDETAGAPEVVYSNSFTCTPHDVTYRPRRSTPTPSIHGIQTAFVVGPSGEELYTKAPGLVKVHFHWDREGKQDENSSCWLRVVQGLAGKHWGGSFWPRIGQEVAVQFIDGNPDRPIVTGVVYNGQAATPYELPARQTLSGWKTLSSKGGGGFNEIRFEDKKDEEQIFLHAQKNLDLRVTNDAFEQVEHDKHLIVKNKRITKVENESHETVDLDRIEKVGKDDHLNVVGKQAVEIGESRSSTVKGDVIDVFKGNHSEQTSGDVYLKASNVVVEGSMNLTLKVGGNSIVIDSTGVTVKGSMVTIDGQMLKYASGPGTSAGSGSAGSAVAPLAPEDPDEADVADPGEVDEIKKEQQAQQTGKYGRAKVVPFKPPGPDDSPGEDKSWIEIELVDEDGNPVPGERYEITLPDGSTVASGTLDPKGFARVEGIDPGNCQITFPNLDKDAWKKA